MPNSFYEQNFAKQRLKETEGKRKQISSRYLVYYWTLSTQ
uniref:Uncharacterized protein n=1 Tax=Lepeophtheirus salmonis TaxID=72036 RepID=A0A0K2U856_LEPSM